MSLKNTYEKITQNRQVLMGIAILWIVWFHSEFYIPIPGMGFLKQCGYGGVDIFLFLSGMGIYCSLDKNPDMLSFYKRRASRIFYTYIPILFMWFSCRVIYDYLYKEDFVGLFESIKGLFGNLSMLGWNNGLSYQFNWYVQAIIWFYLLSPIFYEVLKASYGNVKRYLLLIFILLITQVVFMNFFQTLMAVSRIFIYIMGMLFSQLYKENKNISLWYFVPVMVVGEVLLYLALHIWKKHLWTFGLWWYPYLLITPGLVFVCAYLISFVKSWKIGEVLCNVIGYFGKSSFEIFMVQVAAFNFLTDIIAINSNIRWLLISIFSIGAGVLYSFLLEQFMRRKKA